MVAAVGGSGGSTAVAFVVAKGGGGGGVFAAFVVVVVSVGATVVDSGGVVVGGGIAPNKLRRGRKEKIETKQGGGNLIFSNKSSFRFKTSPDIIIIITIYLFIYSLRSFLKSN